MNCFACGPSHRGLNRRSLKKIIDESPDTKTLASFANIRYRKFNRKRKNLANDTAKLGKGKKTAKIFSYRELRVATQNFHSDNLIGEGGFGRVYKGYLKGSDQVVAVKQLDRNGFQGNKEFLVEVLILSLLRHPNLVHLIGYCVEGDQRVLVYEYMPNGSLEDHLLEQDEGRKPLDWNTRMKIAEGVAKGLEYLHEVAKPQVIYRDLKASNILLDEHFNPKLSDFGLAKLGPTGNKTYISTQVMGTYGYCAPEYAQTGKLTIKSDVYSFGILFLEIITGRRVIDTSRPSEEQNLVIWAQPLFQDTSRFALLADPLLERNYPINGLYQALAIAAMCLQEDASRPLISHVATAIGFLAKQGDENEESSTEEEDNEEEEEEEEKGEEDDDDDGKEGKGEGNGEKESDRVDDEKKITRNQKANCK